MDRLDSATPFSPAPQQEFPDLDSLITSLATHPVKLAFQKFPMSKRFECGMTCCSMPVLKLVFNRVHYRAHMLTIVIGLSLPIPTLTGPTSSVLRSAHWVSATGRVQLLKARLEVRRFLAHLLRPATRSELLSPVGGRSQRNPTHQRGRSPRSKTLWKKGHRPVYPLGRGGSPYQNPHPNECSKVIACQVTEH